MNRKPEKRGRKQAWRPDQWATEKLRQLMLPMIAGIASTKQELTSWVRDAGLVALTEYFKNEAESIAGKKGKHQAERKYNHWGWTGTELTLGGRKTQVRRPRVRSKTGAEMELPSLEQFRQADPLAERVVNQILLGVSTRGYEASLEAAPEDLESRGTSKSAASRHLVSRTREKLRDFLSRSLGGLQLLVLMLDGIEVAGHTVVVALGISMDGRKVPLGLWLGSTENARVCTGLLQDLLSRGLEVEDRILCVVDGGKGIRKALNDVLGDLAVVQRCQVHKLRNIREHLPEKVHALVLGRIRAAYQKSSAESARKLLRGVVIWLEQNGYEEAANSLREGLEETLTVIKLDLPPSLRRSLATTNSIENLLGSIRRVSRNVKRWRGPEMVRRWTALGIVTAEQRFRRIRGYRELNTLLRALRRNQEAVDVEHDAA